MSNRRTQAWSAIFALGLALANVAHANDLSFQHVMDIGAEGIAPGQFKYVEDFAFGKNGELLVTDASHAYVQAFDTRTGKFIARFGGKGDDEASLEKPEGIDVDAEGNIFVADYASGFVKKYDASYKWLITFSGYGSKLGETMKSEFMDIRDGRLYLPDAGNNRVNVFALDGKPLFNFGGPGNAPGKFSVPEAAKFDSSGRLFVSDLKNDRIQVFDAEGNLLSLFGRSGEGSGEFRAPAGLAVDRDDNLYVTEIGNNRVQVFDKAGKFLTMWGRKGSGAGEFFNPHGVIVDRGTGYVYVADTSNNRVQVFKPVLPETLGKSTNSK
jgi:DNA-binding beta-propeller fold protein YncE